MGGASRSGKKRRQAEASRRLAAAGIRVPPKRNRTPLIVVAVVLVVAVIVGATVLLNQASSTNVTPTYTATASGAVVTAGTGPVTIDTYEDFLCPQCERFEQRYGNDITDALNSGQITVRFHTIAILDPSTNPPGYSTRAANAALCAVPAGIYPTYREKLFAEQPAEGSAGLSNDQLIAFGTQLGATGDFAGCVNGATNVPAVTAETNAAAADPALQTGGQFGTPTVARNGAKVDLNNSNWLKDAIAGK
ncbi:thioredoxin domain-containing protein [Pseudonocardia sp.]|jgi:protein-disulfide isomerase|uniref:DsbA family protein n=1 Tax=Pseudonocardia sp. TaxID=60912 RepID=UPI0031FDA86E